MTARELVQRLQELPEDEKDLEVQIFYYCMEDGEGRNVAESIDSVLGPRSYGIWSDKISLGQW